MIDCPTALEFDFLLRRMLHSEFGPDEAEEAYAFLERLNPITDDIQNGRLPFCPSAGDTESYRTIDLAVSDDGA